MPREERKAKRTAKRVSRLTTRAAKNTAKSASTSDSVIKARTARRATRLTAKAEKLSPTKRKIDVPKAVPVSRAKKLEVKKTITKVKTARGTGNTYKSAWEANKGGVQKKYKTYKEFETEAKAYNKTKDAKKRAAGGNDATKHSLTKSRGAKGGKPGKGYMG